MRFKNLTDTGEKRMLWRRIIVYGGAFFVLCVLQCAFFSRLSPLGATPDITLCALLAVAMLDSRRVAAVCAVASGYFLDALGSLSPAFTPVYYLLAVVLIGVLIEKMMKSFLSFLVVLLSAAGLCAVYTWINMWIFFGAIPPISSLWQTLLPSALCTYIFGLPTYFAIKLCTIPIEVNRTRGVNT